MTSTASVPALPPESTSPPAKVDFPTWLPPMLVKELRQGMRTRGFVGAMIVFQLLMVLLMVSNLVGGSFASPAARAATFSVVNGFFWVLLTVQMLVGTPLRALGGLRAEIDTGALDLLVLTRMSAWRIVLGKWGSLMAQALLLMIAMLPYGVVRYFGGSVDLVQDAERCLALIGGCAVITAIALWASSMPRAMQIVVPIVLVVVLQFSTMMARSGAPIFTSTAALPAAIWWFDGAVLMAYFLIASVRRIAPPSDNHVAVARALSVLPLLSVPIWAKFNSSGTTQVQFVSAAIFLAITAIVELASTRVPMAVQWQPWSRRGFGGKIIGRFVMPGWPSALWFVLLAGLATVSIAHWPGLFTPDGVERATWLIGLLVGGLVVPVVVIDLLPTASVKMPLAVYTIVFGAPTVLAVFATAAARGTWLEDFARVLPISSFWLSLDNDPKFSSAHWAQFGVAGVFIVVALLRARPYWEQLRAYEILARRGDS